MGRAERYWDAGFLVGSKQAVGQTVTRRELKQALGLSEKGVTRVINNMVAAGRITLDGETIIGVSPSPGSRPALRRRVWNGFSTLLKSPGENGYALLFSMIVTTIVVGSFNSLLLPTLIYALALNGFVYAFAKTLFALRRVAS